MKKRHCSVKNKFLLAWILYHALIFGSFLISLAFSPKINFATSLFDILPPSSALHEVQAADSKLAAKTARSVTILARAENFEKAKGAAEKFYSSFKDSDYFDSLSLYFDSESVSEITKWLHENRFMLLNDEDIGLLENGGAHEITGEALSSVFGAFSFSDLSYIDEDPFLLSERSLKRFLEGGAVSSTSMALRDDVLAAQKDGFWYVLIRGTVSESGNSVSGKKSTVRKIYELCGQSEDFVFSGVPFHSYENATSAQRQISVISAVAIVLILLAFWGIFRSLVPAFVSALAVAFSCAVGFFSVLLFFRGIHVLTFVFGTTLIGTCLDYSIHYFVNWKKNSACDSGTNVRKFIFRGITLGFASTEICFAALFFAPFPLLKQVSVFLFAGLAASWLSVVALYPMIGKNSLVKPENDRRVKSENDRRVQFVSLKELFRHRVSIPDINPKIWKFVPVLLVIFALTVIINNYRSFGIKNDIRTFYSISENLKRNEIISAQVLNTGSSGWYFIVKADSEESLLQKNEELDSFLFEKIAQSGKGNFLSASQFIPSEKKQKRSWKAAENLLLCLRGQYEALGFNDDSEISGEQKTEVLVKKYENNYRSLKNRFIHPSDSNLPVVIKDAVSNLWIGELEGKFYSCVMPLHINGEENEKIFREFAESHEGIFFVNKVSDISSQLDILSNTMLKMLALAFAAVLVILLFCYPPKTVLKIAAVPFTVTIVTAAVLILCKVPLSFFPVTAIVLVFGLGLDYVIYAIEGKKSNSFAIILSFVTTALSFGALALSTFPPVHTLGLTVFVGLTTAVVTAFCVSGNENQ